MNERRALAVAEVESVIHVGGIEGVGRREERCGERRDAFVLKPVVGRPGLCDAGQAREKTGVCFIHAAVACCHLELRVKTLFDRALSAVACGKQSHKIVRGVPPRGRSETS